MTASKVMRFTSRDTYHRVCFRDHQATNGYKDSIRTYLVPPQKKAIDNSTLGYPEFTRLPPIHLQVWVTEDIGIGVGVKGEAIGPIQGQIEGRSSWHSSDHATASLLDNIVV